MVIKVLGSGCMNCVTLEKRMREAIQQLNLEAIIEKVQDYPAILAYGVMSTPGLVIDEKVVSQGKVPTVEALKEILQQHQLQQSV